MDRLSLTMQDALDYAIEHGGKLKRFPGGFWCRGDLEAWSRPWFGTTTVDALVTRGRMAYTDWVEGKHGRFPVEASIEPDFPD